MNTCFSMIGLLYNFLKNLGDQCERRGYSNNRKHEHEGPCLHDDGVLQCRLTIRKPKSRYTKHNFENLV